MEWLFLAAIAFAVWRWVVRPRKAAFNDAAQVWVEHRMLDLLKQDPHAPDELVATLVRDEIVNQRLRNPELFAWATAATVARLKRTAIRLTFENELRPQMPESPKPQLNPEQVRCAACGTKNNRKRTRCRSCDEPIQA